MMGNSDKESLRKVSILREQKGKGKETLQLINNLLTENIKTGNGDIVVRLYFEKALVHQHEVMEDRSKVEEKQVVQIQEKQIENMKSAILDAQQYIEDNGLKEWESRLARYLGRVADYQEQYDEAVEYYKRAIELADKDPDSGRLPLRLEYKAFLAYSTMMSGKVDEGLSLSK